MSWGTWKKKYKKILKFSKGGLCVLEVEVEAGVQVEVQLQLQVSTSTSTPTGEMVWGDLIELNVLYKNGLDKIFSILHSSGDTGRGPGGPRLGSAADQGCLYNGRLGDKIAQNE